MDLIYKVLFPSISTFETPPSEPVQDSPRTRRATPCPPTPQYSVYDPGEGSFEGAVFHTAGALIPLEREVQ